MSTEVLDMDELRIALDKNPKTVVLASTSWCRPCKKIKPIFEELCQTYKGVSFLRVNADKEEFQEELGIQSVPTFLCWKQGTVPAAKFTSSDPTEVHSLLLNFCS